MRLAMFSWRGPQNNLAGGAESYTHNLLCELANRGHEVTWFTSKDGSGTTKRTDSTEGYRLVQHGNRYTVYHHGREWLKNNASVVDLAIDQVNTIPFSLARANSDVACVGLFHQTAEEVWWSNVNPLVAFVGRFFLEPQWLRSFRDLPVLALSRSTELALKQRGVTNTQVLGAATDTHMPQLRFDIDEREHEICMISRLVNYKRVDHAIEAVARARSAGFPFRLHIVGSGPARAALQRRSPPWVLWHGALSVADRNEVICRSALHLICSQREGWGLTVTESAMLGVPTLGYATPGLVDSITASRGYLCPESPIALSKWLVEIAQSRSWATYEAPVHGGASSWKEIANRFLSFVSENFGDSLLHR